MPLATKNGALIVKDGLLAENCGCCSQAGCAPGSPFLPGPSAPSITVTIANITPTFSSAAKKNSGGPWLDFLGEFSASSQSVQIPLYLNYGVDNNLTYSGQLYYELITKNDYGVGSVEREFPPSVFGLGSELRCLYRRGTYVFSYEVRKPAATGGVMVPAYSIGWQVNDGAFVYVQGAITGAINFVPPGISPNEWPQPRFQAGSASLTAGGFYFTAGFAYRGFPDTQTIQSQTSTNLFASTVAGTTFDWSYDITVAMQ